MDRERRIIVEPSPAVPDPERVFYLSRLGTRRPRTTWRMIGTSLLQGPRLALLGLFMIMAGMIGRSIALYWAGVGKGHSDLYEGGIGVLWLWGTVLLGLELVFLSVRDAADLPWSGTAPTTTRILLRWLGGCLLMSFLGISELSLLIALVPLAAISWAMYAWNLPATLRGLRTARLGLASLRVVGAPVTPGRLPAGARGRRIIQGRWSRDRGPITFEGDGQVAWLEGVADVVELDREGEMPDGRPPRAVVAEVHAGDEGGYRSAGVRLSTGGLPVWLLHDEDLEERVARVRRRLRASAILDGIHVTVATIGAALVALYMIAYAAR